MKVSMSVAFFKALELTWNIYMAESLNSSSKIARIGSSHEPIGSRVQALLP